MSLDKATVARMAELARIALPEDQLEQLVGELSGILAWVEQLAEVDTEGVEPLRSVHPIRRSWRADEVTDGNCREAILANAPERENGYFVVPRVVE
ncbi:MAG: Asp-tRNA(Asn)/Glu-tRNA(Gln) amidotransferase subunit GatC [Geminicoccaceae bacterium]|nr:Asp-tRNA(Asn)/Glu-tRNA(Gln) amidotransferase subunit GatC [Geminicoccaceae bacterium]MCS7267719.1 Asp-tRNA(Asn)/Glu-tRNA(Gln) amidotransferase subunit GatC [Geminicoccaceae bacterium]MCX7629356.1 Asp-tRNA(Asn)/Glu-tRNA(Gln) amidotransferase subunit GatC [Geminicoccaceae bacterium]MDW8123562.1 Asp-tRNA(Asn)/Glu-tRNA(Gln) amidotransferase subunit GatC [Geminicoccaceae bacterium]MDW8339903.1 Asp-tRNA(Asn)/Glu-tRNA(Gln) amidotransferase subunit GatC [Geminicoccaceae bacterium]